MRRSRFLSAGAVSVAAALLGVSGCSKSATPSDDSSPSPTPTPSTTTPPPPTGGTVKVSGPFGKQPTVKVPKPFAVDKTKVHVIRRGDGATVKRDDLVKVDYVGIDGASNKVFDSSWKANRQAVFELTQGALIPGFLTGLVGQKVGSRVEIEIPPDQGYGPNGLPQAGIGGTDTLVFVIDLHESMRPLTKISGKQRKPAPGFPAVKMSKGLPTALAPDPATVGKPRSDVLITGTGPKVKQGQTIKFTYLAAVLKTGRPFDRTYGQQAVTIGLDDNLAIAGMADQIVGKHVGSRVEMLLPKALANVSQLPNGVKKNDTIVFVLDILGAL